MSTFTNCRVTGFGIGFSFGEGVNATLNGCYASDSGVGYSFHENSNIQVNRSSSKNNRVGVDIFGQSEGVVSNHKISFNPSSPIRPIPVKKSYIGAVHMYYVRLYLRVFNYDIHK